MPISSDQFNALISKAKSFTPPNTTGGGIDDDKFKKVVNKAQGLPAKKPSFVGGMLRGIVKPIARVGQSLDAIGGVIKGKSLEEVGKGNYSPYLGQVYPVGFGKDFNPEKNPVRSALSAVGTGADIGTNIATFGEEGIAKEAIKTTGEQIIKGVTKQGVKTLAKEGATYGAGQGLSTGFEKAADAKTAGKGALDIVGSTAIGAITGGVFGAATPFASQIIGGPLRSAIDKLAPKTKEFFENKIKSKVVDNWNKAFPTGIKGTRTATAVKGYFNNAVNAVRTIIENKKNLNLTDEAGNKIDLPTNRGQMQEAINQIKSQLYKEYTSMAEKAGDLGANMKKGVGDLITKFRKNLETKNLTGETKGQLSRRLVELQNLKDHSPAGIQSYIEELNQGLGALFGSGADKRRASVDASIALQLRDGLDEMISGLQGEGYKDLRKKYSAFKSIEDDIARAANKQRNLIAKDTFGKILDPFSEADMTTGILTLNPTMFAKGLTLQGFKRLKNYMMNPDRFVKNMFQDIDKLYSDATGSLGEFGTPERVVPPRNVPVKSLPSDYTNTPNKSIQFGPKGKSAPSDLPTADTPPNVYKAPWMTSDKMRPDIQF